jgi:hypothetical protein
MPHGLSKEILGYQIHTNRELGMMLRGEKPLAVFADVEGFFPALVLRYLRIFDRHARTGRFIKREHRVPIDIRGNHHVLLTILYALPEQAWRIDSMIELCNHIPAGPWTDEHERMAGTLLGYTDSQNDTWIARRSANR